MPHPQITRFRQAAALTAWLLTLLTLVPILLNGVIHGTLVLPFTLSQGQLAWVAALMPFVSFICTWLIHGVTTNDWSPPAVDAILKLFQGSTPSVPIIRNPPPLPDAGPTLVLYQDHLASIRPVAPLTGQPPPEPVP